MLKKSAPPHPNNLAQVLAEKGMSGKALERATGLGHATIVDLKNGNQRFSMESLEAIAQALDVPMGRLMPDWEPPVADAGGTHPTAPWSRFRLGGGNPRKGYDPDALKALAGSIDRKGVVTPLLVYESAPGAPLEIIAGQRRFRAVEFLIKEGGANEDFPLPYFALAGTRAGDPEERLIAALVENMAREDMNPADEGEAYLALQNDHGVSTQDIAQFIGRTQRYVQGRAKLARELSPAALDALRMNKINCAQAEGLLDAPDPKTQDRVLGRVLAGDPSLRTEDQIRAAAKPAPRPEREDLQTDLEDFAETRDSGTQGDGRMIAADDQRFFREAQAENPYQVTLGQPAPGTYRKPRKGQATVADICPPGALVKTNYGTGPFRVTTVLESVWKAPDGTEWTSWSLRLKDAATGVPGYSLNNFVAVQGRILHLFANNDDEVIVMTEDEIREFEAGLEAAGEATDQTVDQTEQAKEDEPPAAPDRSGPGVDSDAAPALYPVDSPFVFTDLQYGEGDKYPFPSELAIGDPATGKTQSYVRKQGV